MQQHEERFYLSKTDEAEVSLTEGDIGAVMIVSVIDKSGKKRIEGIQRIPRKKLVELKQWLDDILKPTEDKNGSRKD